MSVLVWSMAGIALWHFTVLLPDELAGGIIGAFLAALIGALVSGYALPTPGLPTENPPGLSEAIRALPCSAIALAGSYVWGSRQTPTSNEHADGHAGARAASACGADSIIRRVQNLLDWHASWGPRSRSAVRRRWKHRASAEGFRWPPSAGSS